MTQATTLSALRTPAGKRETRGCRRTLQQANNPGAPGDLDHIPLGKLGATMEARG